MWGLRGKHMQRFFLFSFVIWAFSFVHIFVQPK